MSTHYEAAHLRFGAHDGFKDETVGIGSLDGRDVQVRAYVDDEEVLHVIVLDSVSRDTICQECGESLDDLENGCNACVQRKVATNDQDRYKVLTECHVEAANDGGFVFVDDGMGRHLPLGGLTDDDRFELLVAACWWSNRDDSYHNKDTGEYEPYDRYSATAAVEAMLMDEESWQGVAAELAQ